MKSKEELWWDAFLAYTQTGMHESVAREHADDAVTAYEKRWPETALTSMIGSPVDVGVLQRAISQLDAGNRHDAHLVVKSLYDAIRKAMAEGKQLTSWTPPPRGG